MRKGEPRPTQQSATIGFAVPELQLLPAIYLITAGMLAGFVNVIAAGGSLLTMPLLIFLGLPPSAAVGTVRLSIFVQCVTATLRFHRAGRVPWPSVAKHALPICLGAIAGALLATQIGDDYFRAIIGWVTLGAGALVAIDFNALLRRDAQPSGKSQRIVAMVALMLVGFYAGLVQAGTGFLLLAALVIGVRLPLLEANIMKVVLVLCLTPIALLVFGLSGQIHWSYALVLALGQAIGAFVGATVSLRSDASFIRPILALVVTAAAIRLLVY